MSDSILRVEVEFTRGAKLMSERRQVRGDIGGSGDGGRDKSNRNEVQRPTAATNRKRNSSCSCSSSRISSSQIFASLCIIVQVARVVASARVGSMASGEQQLSSGIIGAQTSLGSAAAPIGRDQQPHRLVRLSGQQAKFECRLPIYEDANSDHPLAGIHRPAGAAVVSGPVGVANQRRALRSYLATAETGEESVGDSAVDNARQYRRELVAQGDGDDDGDSMDSSIESDNFVAQDSVELILWYHSGRAAGGTNGQPIYSVDARALRQQDANGNRQQWTPPLAGESAASGHSPLVPVAMDQTMAAMAADTRQLHKSSYYLANNATPARLLANLASGIGARHYAAARLSNRIRLQIIGSSAYLIIERVESTDTGQYKCRVDYKFARTSYQISELDVIVPVTKIEIKTTTITSNNLRLPQRDAKENNSNSMAQSVTVIEANEDEFLELECLADNGWPKARVAWWRTEFADTRGHRTHSLVSCEPSQRRQLISVGALSPSPSSPPLDGTNGREQCAVGAKWSSMVAQQLGGELTAAQLYRVVANADNEQSAGDDDIFGANDINVIGKEAKIWQFLRKRKMTLYTCAASNTLPDMDPKIESQLDEQQRDKLAKVGQPIFRSILVKPNVPPKRVQLYLVGRRRQQANREEQAIELTPLTSEQSVHLNLAASTSAAIDGPQLQFLCLVGGSVPRAKLEWSRRLSGGDDDEIALAGDSPDDTRSLLELATLLNSTPSAMKNDGHTTSRYLVAEQQWSSLRLRNITIGEHQTIIKCSALNEEFAKRRAALRSGDDATNSDRSDASSSLSTSIRLNITHVPLVRLALGLIDSDAGAGATPGAGAREAEHKTQRNVSSTVHNDNDSIEVETAKTTATASSMTLSVDSEKVWPLSEGSNVTLVCQVTFANPTMIGKIEWLLNDSALQEPANTQRSARGETLPAAAATANALPVNVVGRTQSANGFSFVERLTVQFSGGSSDRRSSSDSPLVVKCSARNAIGRATSNGIRVVIGRMPRCSNRVAIRAPRSDEAAGKSVDIEPSSSISSSSSKGNVTAISNVTADTSGTSNTKVITTTTTTTTITTTTTTNAAASATDVDYYLASDNDQSVHCPVISDPNSSVFHWQYQGNSDYSGGKKSVVVSTTRNSIQLSQLIIASNDSSSDSSSRGKGRSNANENQASSSASSRSHHLVTCYASDKFGSNDKESCLIRINILLGGSRQRAASVGQQLQLQSKSKVKGFLSKRRAPSNCDANLVKLLERHEGTKVQKRQQQQQRRSGNNNAADNDEDNRIPNQLETYLNDLAADSGNSGSGLGNSSSNGNNNNNGDSQLLLISRLAKPAEVAADTESAGRLLLTIECKGSQEFKDVSESEESRSGDSDGLLLLHFDLYRRQQQQQQKLGDARLGFIKRLASISYPVSSPPQKRLRNQSHNHHQQQQQLDNEHYSVSTGDGKAEATAAATAEQVAANLSLMLDLEIEEEPTVATTTKTPIGQLAEMYFIVMSITDAHDHNRYLLPNVTLTLNGATAGGAYSSQQQQQMAVGKFPRIVELTGGHRDRLWLVSSIVAVFVSSSVLLIIAWLCRGHNSGGGGGSSGTTTGSGASTNHCVTENLKVTINECFGKATSNSFGLTPDSSDSKELMMMEQTEMYLVGEPLLPRPTIYHNAPNGRYQGLGNINVTNINQQQHHRAALLTATTTTSAEPFINNQHYHQQQQDQHAQHSGLNGEPLVQVQTDLGETVAVDPCDFLIIDSPNDDQQHREQQGCNSLSTVAKQQAPAILFIDTISSPHNSQECATFGDQPTASHLPTCAPSSLTTCSQDTNSSSSSSRIGRSHAEGATSRVCCCNRSGYEANDETTGASMVGTGWRPQSRSSSSNSGSTLVRHKVPCRRNFAQVLDDSGCVIRSPLSIGLELNSQGDLTMTDESGSFIHEDGARIVCDHNAGNQNHHQHQVASSCFQCQKLMLMSGEGTVNHLSQYCNSPSVSSQTSSTSQQQQQQQHERLNMTIRGQNHHQQDKRVRFLPNHAQESDNHLS